MPEELTLPPGPTLWRGVTRRCGACGRGRLFRRWFSMVERCPGCGLMFERIDGHWTGSLGLNTIVTFSVLFWVIVAGTLLTAPDVPVGPLVAASVAVGVGLPLALFPFTRTAWLAIDLLMRPPTTAEVDASAAGVTPLRPAHRR